jgi:hypothetical protein
MLSLSDRALQALQARSDGTWRVTKNPATELPRMLAGAKSGSYGTNPVQAAQAFLAENTDLFLPGSLSKPAGEGILLHLASSRSFLGKTVVEFREEYKGVPVYGATVTVMVDSTGRVVHVTSTADPRAIVSAEAARRFEDLDATLKASRTNQSLRLVAATNTLVILPGATPRLAYQAFYKVGASGEPWEYLIDAVTGQTLKTHRLVQEDSFRPAEGRQAAPLATCSLHVDLTAGHDGRGMPGQVVAAASCGAFGGTNYTLSASADLVGGKDEDGDGYCDTYCLQIFMDALADPGPAVVDGSLVCNTTGQRWFTATPWSVKETAGERQVFTFDEASFPEAAGISGLDFTAEIRVSGDSAGKERSKNADLPQRWNAARAKAARPGALMSESRSLVFDPNPVNTLNTTNLPRQYYSDDPVFSNAYVEVDLTQLTHPLPGNLYQLIGKYAALTNLEDPATSLPSSTNGVFAYHRDNPAFQEVMCYYHVTRNQEYIQSLGFTNVDNRQHAIDAHSYATDDTTFYGAYYKVSPPTFPYGFGYLAFGEDYVPYAEDADVILHEYGHSIQDNSSIGKYLGANSRGLGDETGAMGEGFGDYWACSCTYAQSVANGFDPAIVAEWALPPAAWRRVDATKHYPESMSNDIHDDGEIWSTCLWDIFAALGKDSADKIILGSHFLVPLLPSFEDGAYAMLAADDILYDGAHTSVISNIFVARGILGSPPRGKVQFSASGYLADENGGPLTITITRTGGSSGPASVAYATSSGTATQSLDYTEQTGAVSWTNGDASPQTFAVDILSDALTEGEETFTVSLSDSIGVALGDPASATVTIVDVAIVSGGGGGTAVLPSSANRSSRSSGSGSTKRQFADDSMSGARDGRSSGATGNSSTAPSFGGNPTSKHEDAETDPTARALASADTESQRGKANPDDPLAEQRLSTDPWTPLQLSFCPPIQLFSSEGSVIGLRLNILVGYSETLTGLDVGTVANQVGDMKGLQLALGNQALSFSGVQVGLANQVGCLGPPEPMFDAKGSRVAARSTNSGLQIGLLNTVGKTLPWEPDYTPDVAFVGLQLGVMNIADDIRGVQLGALMNQADQIHGLQVGLLWNQARVLHGVQIGLLNNAGNAPLSNVLGGIPILNAAF